MARIIRDGSARIQVVCYVLSVPAEPCIYLVTCQARWFEIILDHVVVSTLTYLIIVEGSHKNSILLPDVHNRQVVLVIHDLGHDVIYVCCIPDSESPHRQVHEVILRVHGGVIEICN